MEAAARVSAKNDRGDIWCGDVQGVFRQQLMGGNQPGGPGQIPAKLLQLVSQPNARAIVFS
jgi:hypothetical protein